MPSNLAAYLAKNYLTASTPSNPGEPPKKKRKKSKHAPETGLVIADDEDLSLSGRNGAAHDDEDNDGDVPMMYEGKSRSAEFRKAKKSAWKTLASDPEAVSTTRDEDEDGNDEADNLLRTAQSDEQRRLAERAADDAPTIVDDDTAPGMEGGMRAGLQTAADTARLIAEEEARSALAPKKSKKKKPTADDEEDNPESQTVYRDATGRRIDISQRRAEARREAEAKAAAAKEEKLSSMGEVQRRALESRKQDLEDAKFLTLGRGVDDDEYNAHLKGQARWDDPMAQYMAEKRAEEDAVSGKINRSQEGGKPVVRKKEYQGAAPPNRYGIKPGWRWDGVDRGNGFEKEWFQARSRRSRNEQLSYEWQMDE